MARDNEAAFRVFESTYYPQIIRYLGNYLRDAQSGCKFGAITLMGAPHLHVVDKKQRERFIVLLPSKWDGDDLKAYLELQSVIISKRFNADPASIWPMDLKDGGEVRWRSSSRVRRKCETAADLYGRLIRALEYER